MEKKLSVLIVDDDKRIGNMFSEVLKEEGHSVQSVTTGEDAVKVYKPGLFDLVFLDMILPGMDGLKTLQTLKASDENVRVVIMTGYSVLGMLEDAAKIGVITTLIKPFHLGQIKQAVDQSVVAPQVAVETKAYAALIIDDQEELLPKFSNVLNELDFEIITYRTTDEADELTKAKEFDLILINTITLRKNTMETFYYMKQKMPTSKCVMLIDEYMNIQEASSNLTEMFKKA